MPQELIQVDAHKRLSKIVLILLILVGAVWTYYAFRWYLGNTLAEYFNTTQNNLDVARMAETMAPGDPLTHWRLAQVSQKRLPLDQASAALVEFERAVSLSPNDYRMWLSLGTAREQAGEKQLAELALRRSVELAPSYAYPHWYLGNLLLRDNRYDEAFAELRLASDSAPEELRPQLFNLVWTIYSDNFDGQKKALGDSATARAQFAIYLLAQQKFDDGIRMWNSLSAPEKAANDDSGNSIIKTLVSNQRFRDALLLWNDMTAVGARKIVEGEVSDKGFEEAGNYGPDNLFGWQVKDAPQVQIGIDPKVSHSGGRSLRILFRVRSKISGVGASQLVLLEPDSTYDFECFQRTTKLQSGTPPIIQIEDASVGGVLATSNSPPTDSDWDRVSLTFKTSPKTQAVTLRITTPSCGDAPLCPIFGTIWYDDFSFKRQQ